MGKAVEAESLSGNGIVLTSAESWSGGREGGGILVKVQQLGRNHSDLVQCRNTLVPASITLSEDNCHSRSRRRPEETKDILIPIQMLQIVQTGFFINSIMAE